MQLDDQRKNKLVNVRSLGAGFATIEKQLRPARLAARKLRYRTLLRGLPDWLLGSLCNAMDGDMLAISVLRTLTHRVGWLIHDSKNPCHLPSNETQEDAEIDRVAPIIMQDCARERVRRMGLLREFEPCPDPFGLVYTDAPKVTASAAGKALEGEAKELFDVIISGAKS